MLMLALRAPPVFAATEKDKVPEPLVGLLLERVRKELSVVLAPQRHELDPVTVKEDDVPDAVTVSKLPLRVKVHAGTEAAWSTGKTVPATINLAMRSVLDASLAVARYCTTPLPVTLPVGLTVSQLVSVLEAVQLHCGEVVTEMVPRDDDPGRSICEFTLSEYAHAPRERVTGITSGLFPPVADISVTLPV
jgi:hypothetical protein